MSLTTTSLGETVKKQYLFKLKANIDSLSSLIGIQLLAIVFSIGGVGSSGMGGMDYSINIKHYSVDLVLAFTMIWSFVTAITITTKPYRNQDFSFVSNRLSSSLANMLFILTVSVLAGFTALLSGNLLQIVLMFFAGQQFYYINDPSSLFLGLFVVLIYLLLVSSLGYFVGSLVQVNKIFIIIIPAVFIGLLFLGISIWGQPVLVSVFQFYLMESVLSLFLVKAVATMVIFFTLAIRILNTLEVRR